MRLVRCQADQFLKYVVDFLLVRAQFPRLCGGVRKIITCILSLLKLVEAGVCADVHRAVEQQFLAPILASCSNFVHLLQFRHPLSAGSLVRNVVFMNRLSESRD